MSAGDAIRNAVPTPSIDQSVIVLGALAFAWLIYITTTKTSSGQTHLAAWLAILGV